LPKYLKLFSKYKNAKEFPEISKFLMENKQIDKKELVQALAKAIHNNNINMAETLLKQGATFKFNGYTDQMFWSAYLNQQTISWLLKKGVSPFEGRHPITNLIDFRKITYENLEAILKMLPKKDLKSGLLDEIFISVLNKLQTFTTYYDLKAKLDLFEKYNLNINSVKTKEGKSYLEEYINNMVKFYTTKNLSTKELLVVLLGGKPTQKNLDNYKNSGKSYFNNYRNNIFKKAYLRKNSTIDMDINNPKYKKDLNRYVENALRNYDDYKRMVELFTMIKIFPKLKFTQKRDKFEYLSYYSSHSEIWEYIKFYLVYDNKDNSAEYIKKLYNILINNNFELPRSCDTVTKEEKKEWMLKKYPKILQ